MKLWAIVVIVAICAVLLVGVYYAGMRNAKVIKVADHETTINTTIPVRTHVIREQLPAVIDTVWIDRISHEVARYSETIDTNRVYVDLNVEYDEYSNLFNIKHSVMALRDSVYKEKIVERLTPYKPRFATPCGGLGVGFVDKQIDNASIDLGVVFRGRYQTTAYIDTNKRYGARLGVIW